MKTIKVNEKEYVLEFSFEAAERKEVVQDMFNILSGTYIIKNASRSKSAGAAMLNGVTEMVADIPRIAREAFYVGLLENQNLSAAEAKEVMKSYMKENKLTYNDLFEDKWYYVTVLEATITHNYYLDSKGFEYKWEDWK